MPVFQTIQFVKASPQECWSFFSNPSNLSLITPPDMDFQIYFPDPVPPMYQGLIIRYKVRPLFNIPLDWITEITQVEEGSYFVDNQVKGPFRLWHHQHFFKEVPGGIEMLDIVNYELPLGRLGELLSFGIVRKRVERIFAFRRKVIREVWKGSE
jgi:ligand-binding SRPBCC domain-containing protein